MLSSLSSVAGAIGQEPLHRGALRALHRRGRALSCGGALSFERRCKPREGSSRGNLQRRTSIRSRAELSAHRATSSSAATATAAESLSTEEFLNRPEAAADPAHPATSLPGDGSFALDLGRLLRKDFPILNTSLGDGLPLVYLDSAATSQKPQQVLDAMDDYYSRYNANVHRGVHTLSALATEAYEGARDAVQGLIGAERREEIVFTRNASEAINLVAYTWASANLKPGDEVVLTVAEHHSNLVPWQMAAQRTGAVLRFAPLKPVSVEVEGQGEGEPLLLGAEEVDVEQLLGLITERTRLVAVQHVSNVLGSELPVERVVQRAHEVGALVLVDACQSVPHMTVDVQRLGADFLVASGHKMLAPTGIGFLYGRHSLLSAMPPFLGGGEMIADVFLDHSTYAEPPAKFEAGTPAIAEAVGLNAAIQYMQSTVPGGVEALHRYELALTAYLYSKMVQLPGVRIYGPPPCSSPFKSNAYSPRSAALCAFNVEGIHPTDLSTFLDQQHGIAIRSGHHCAQPLHQALDVSSSARVSLHCYNTTEDVDAFIAALRDTQDFFLG